MKPPGLLDELWDRVGCPYLSDLKDSVYTYAVRHALDALPPAAYTLREWEDAVHYLADQTVEFPSAETARCYLLEHLE